MCDLCGELNGGAHGASFSDRPPHRLAGRVWEGSFAQAGRGAIHSLIEEIRAFSDSRADGLWRSPIVGLSLAEWADGFRYFVGVAVEATETVPTGFEVVDLPEMTFMSAWHLPEDGDVAAHYDKMAGMIGEIDLVWDRSRLHRREEYPPDVDLSLPLSLRLMLPVARRADTMAR